MERMSGIEDEIKAAVSLPAERAEALYSRFVVMEPGRVRATLVL